MTINWWTLGLQTVNVVILIWLLGRFFWRPVAAMIEQRRAAAQRILAEAEAKHNQATAAFADIERTRAGFAGEREAILAAAHEAAERARAARLEEVEKQAASLRSGRESSDREGAGGGRQGMGRAGKPACGRNCKAPGRPAGRSDGACSLPGLAPQGDPDSSRTGTASCGGGRRNAGSDQRDTARSGRRGALPGADRRGVWKPSANRFQDGSSAHRRPRAARTPPRREQ